MGWKTFLWTALAVVVAIAAWYLVVESGFRSGVISAKGSVTLPKLGAPALQ